MAHQQNKDTNDNRMYLLKNGTARIDEDGINQAQYKVLSTVVTDLFTKISVDLLYADYIATYVSIRFSYLSNNYMVFHSNPDIHYTFQQNDTELAIEFEETKRRDKSKRKPKMMFGNWNSKSKS